jgi:6-phosphogluconolactonase (cycloisomerase 2 family)
MFAARFVAPSIVSKNSGTDAQLVAKKVKQSRRALVERQRPSRKSHQADLCGEAQLIAMATLSEDQVQVFAAQRGVADQVSFVDWSR